MILLKNQNQQEKKPKKYPPWPIKTTFNFSMMQARHTERNYERSNKEFRLAINGLWWIILATGSKSEK